jgi:hypothetical protein
MTTFRNMIIDFSACEGFGTSGLTATLYHCGSVWGSGHGSTEDEAVLEAMLSAGVKFDTALDECGKVIANARKITRATT